MDEAPPIEVVLIDWAGTITRPMVEMLQAALEHLEWDEATTQKAMVGFATYFEEDSLFHQAERGDIPDSDLIEWMEAQAPGGSRLFATDEPSFLNASDRPEMIDLLWWLQDVDVMVMLATNNFVSAQDMLADRYLSSGLVHAIVNSALIGARKPERKFWEIILDAVEVDPAQIVLLDDNATNLESATAMGMRTIPVGEDPVEAIDQLKALLA